LTSEFERVLPQLSRIARAVTNDEAHAEDIVQDTFLIALDRCDRFRDGAELLPWLQGILVNLARQHRKNTSRCIEVERLDAREVEDPSESLQRDQVRQAIDRSIAQLPGRYREVVRMRLIGQSTIDEIASSLARPQSTIRTQLSRGLERLRSLLPPGLAEAAVLFVSSTTCVVFGS